MNRYILPYAVCIIALASCSKITATAATGAVIAPQPDQAKPALINTTQIASDVVAYALIRAMVRNPQILTRKWAQMSVIFPDCSLPPRERDLQCPTLSGIRKISVQDGGAGVITIETTKPVTCSGIYNIVKDAFGPGRQGEGICDVEWNLSRWVKGGHASIFSSPKDPARIFFQMNLDQGP